MVFCRGEEYKTTERSHECIEEFGLNPVGDFIFICKQHLVSFLFLAFLCFFSITGCSVSAGAWYNTHISIKFQCEII